MRMFFAVVVCFVTTYVRAQDEEKRTNEVRARILDINRELATIADHPWAGEYNSHDGLGLRLYIAPKTGLAYQLHGCLGLYEQNVGSIDKKESEIHVVWKWSDIEGLHNATNYIPISWGTDSFLVAQQDILAFCIDARSDRTFVGIHSLRRVGGTKGKPTGKPHLPEVYEKYRSLAHVRAEIVQVSAPTTVIADGLERIRQTFTIDAGRNEGLLPKMSLYIPIRRGQQSYSCTVTVADEFTSTVVATTIQQPGDEPYPIKSGERVTTNWFSILEREGP